MFLPPRPVRHLVHLLPYPLNLVVVLVALVVPAWIWWQSTRDDPVLRGRPYGRVVPDDWHEPGPPPYLPATPRPADGSESARRTEPNA